MEAKHDDERSSALDSATASIDSLLAGALLAKDLALGKYAKDRAMKARYDHAAMYRRLSCLPTDKVRMYEGLCTARDALSTEKGQRREAAERHAREAAALNSEVRRGRKEARALAAELGEARADVGGLEARLAESRATAVGVRRKHAVELGRLEVARERSDDAHAAQLRAAREGHEARVRELLERQRELEEDVKRFRDMHTESALGLLEADFGFLNGERAYSGAYR